MFLPLISLVQVIIGKLSSFVQHVQVDSRFDENLRNWNVFDDDTKF